MTLACGGLISRDGTNVLSESLTAALTFDPQGNTGRERLIVRLDYRVNQGSVSDFGWVMAVPGKPEVAPAPDNLFSALNSATIYKKNYLEKLFDALNPKTFDGITRGSSSGAAAPGGGVTVVSQTRVGAFDISVVSATEQGALTQWATANGYTTPILNTDAVKDYLAKGWFFALAKLVADNKSGATVAAGQSQPLLLTFDTPEPIYPWRLSAYNPDGKLATNRVLPTRLYIFQPDLKTAPKNDLPGLDLRYAGPLDPSASASLLKDLPGDNQRPYFLTSYDGSVKAPDIVNTDLTLQKAANQDEYGTGKLSGLDWLWAILGTIFFGQLALLITLWILFTSDAVGVIVALALLGLVAAFVIPRRPRPIALIVLSALNAVLGSGMALASVGTTPLVLVSLLPLWGLVVWAVRAAFARKTLKQ